MNRPLLVALLYAALGFGANPLQAGVINSAERLQIQEMRVDDMRKLRILETPASVPDIPYETPDGKKIRLSDSNGHFRLVNFWATWCIPCREEMPALDALQARLGSDNFEVITIATGRNRLSGIHEFFAAAKIENLPILLDPRGQLGRSIGALGLPTTVFLNRDGKEIARVTGGADWSSDNAAAVLQALMDASDSAGN